MFISLLIYSVFRLNLFLSIYVIYCVKVKLFLKNVMFSKANLKNQIKITKLEFKIIIKFLKEI